MPSRLVVSSDRSRLNMERPAGPAVYASFVLDLLAESAAIDLVGPERAAGADVILSLDGRFRAGRGQRTVTTVLDLGYLFERQGYGRLQWLRQNWRVASAVRRSDHLLVPSEAVRLALERYLNVPAGRITVLSPRPAPGFRRPGRARVESVRRELRLPDRYFVFVGTRSRRKNLELLAAAWPRLAGVVGADVQLVLAGPGTGAGGVPGARDLGWVDAERLPAVIAGAIAWVNPSLYEGSPIGALEAMACGTPPLVAATGAQPRAVSMAGLSLDPHDAEQWGRAMIAVTADPELRGRLSVSALKAAAELREARPRWEDLLPALTGCGAGT